MRRWQSITACSQQKMPSRHTAASFIRSCLPVPGFSGYVQPDFFPDWGPDVKQVSDNLDVWRRCVPPETCILLNGMGC
ncbi:MAG: hypothetical protein CM1200mP30_01350 [Pseudomonadota bacterium]|nr:MAG: hypothetical protein CM1200mP30_01350 [Pseudomonadota bacterium]